jgi:hypothetical protein
MILSDSARGTLRMICFLSALAVAAIVNNLLCRIGLQARDGIRNPAGIAIEDC